MCGRYALKTALADLQRVFGFEGPLPNLPARYNVAPTQGVPVIRLEGGKRRLVMMRWGLVPSWAREIGDKPLINARAETVLEKPSFKAAIARRRCLVPADAIYEWQKHARGAAVPYAIRSADGAPFAMAGIWEVWQSPDGSELESVAILTVDANETLTDIHHRMPAVLSEPDWDAWLDVEGTSAEQARALLRPAPEDAFTAYAISTLVNAVANDSPAVLEPAAPEAEQAKTEPEDAQLCLL